jgi:hypothetical protein
MIISRVHLSLNHSSFIIYQFHLLLKNRAAIESDIRVMRDLSSFISVVECIYEYVYVRLRIYCTRKHTHKTINKLVILRRGAIVDADLQSGTSIVTRVTNLTAIITTSQTMKKSNTDKITTAGDRSGINLKNLSYSKDSPRNFWENKKLLDKDSSSDDIMRSIAK